MHNNTFSLKDIGVTTLTFQDHVTSLMTSSFVPP